MFKIGDRVKYKSHYPGMELKLLAVPTMFEHGSGEVVREADDPSHKKWYPKGVNITLGVNEICFAEKRENPTYRELMSKIK